MNTKMVSGISLVLATAMLASCTASPQADEASAGEEAGTETEVLRVGNEGDYPPFSQTNPDGSLSGFDIDIANALCAEMQVECEFVVNEWSTIIPGLDANKYDVIISSMAINDERKEKVTFTQPYHRSGYAFIAPQEVTFELTEEGLSDKTICVFKNSVGNEWLTQTAPEIELLQYDDTQTLKTDLFAGRCDAAFDSKLPMQEILNSPEGEGYHFVGEEVTDPVLGEGAGIAVRKEDEELAERLDQAIDAIYADGTFQSINDEYFPFSIGTK